MIAGELLTSFVEDCVVHFVIASEELPKSGDFTDSTDDRGENGRRGKKCIAIEWGGRAGICSLPKTLPVGLPQKLFWSRQPIPIEIPSLP